MSEPEQQEAPQSAEETQRAATGASEPKGSTGIPADPKEPKEPKGCVNPIDGVRTAKTKRAEETDSEQETRRPRFLRNWAGIKRAWLEGEPVVDIARRHGMSAASIYNKACKNQWKRRQEPAVVTTGPAPRLAPQLAQKLHPAIKEQVAQAVPQVAAAVRVEVTEWLQGVLHTAKALKGALDYRVERGLERLEVEELKSLSLTLASVNQTARLTFGLDDRSGSMGSTSAYNLSRPDAVVLDAVVVEPVQERKGLPEADAQG